MNNNQQRNKKMYRQSIDNWYLERVVYLVAGIFVMGSLGLVFAGINEAIYFAFFVGLMLVNFAINGYCPISILLHKLGVREK